MSLVQKLISSLEFLVKVLPPPILSVVVEYDYVNAEEGNLQLQRGDEVIVTERREGWMWGYNAGVYGKLEYIFAAFVIVQNTDEDIF